VAKRGREAVAKRARELKRQQDKESKRTRSEAAAGRSPSLSPEAEMTLLEEFAVLGEKFEADLVKESEYRSERHRIFLALGIEAEEDG
jgi:hypothetical protein